MTSPPVRRSAWVNRTPEDAFAIFTDEIGAWWPLPTHGLFGQRSSGVLFRDGQLIEQSVDGAEIVWGEVVAWTPPERLVIAWHPGADAGESTEVTVSFEPHDAGTQVVIEHHGWERFGDSAASRRLGYVGPNAWGYVLDHFADGAEGRLDGIDLAALAEAYEAFFAEASRGGFGPANDREWNAEQVIAHVALNDAAMLNVCQAIIHQTASRPLDTRFENIVSQNRTVLAAAIDSAGSMDELIARARHGSRLVVACLARLSPEQRETNVHCHLLHYDDVMVDSPLPWHAVAVHTQATVHLPAHVAQLIDLRS